MKFSHFQQIVDKIRVDVPCPECGAFFDEAEIDIVGVSPQNIEFYIPCSCCGAEVMVLAQIEIIQRVHQTLKTPPTFETGKKNISPNIVKDISTLLQTFRGRDVRELFK